MTRTINSNIEAWRIVRSPFPFPPDWVLQAFLKGDIHWLPEWREPPEYFSVRLDCGLTGQWIFAGPAIGRYAQPLTEPSWLLRHSTGKLEVMSDKDLVARFGDGK